MSRKVMQKITSSSTCVVTMHSGRYLPTNPKQSPMSSMKYSGKQLNCSGGSPGRGNLFEISFQSSQEIGNTSTNLINLPG